MGFELDHFFVAVPGPTHGLDALRDAGFLEGPSRDHPGQGTASCGVFFENAYLELIWLTDPVAADSPAIRRTGLRHRTDAGLEACPFGLALRSGGAPGSSMPFGVWEYRPPWVPAGTFIPVAESSEDLEQPLVFLLPWRDEPGWAVPDHPNGARCVTAVSIILGEHALESPVIESLSAMGVADISVGSEYFMDVELDECRRAQCIDLRPETPLRLCW